MAELDANLLQLILKRLDSLDKKFDALNEDASRHRFCQETTLPELVATVKRHTDELDDIKPLAKDLRSIGRFAASVMVIVLAAGVHQLGQWILEIYRHMIGGH